MKIDVLNYAISFIKLWRESQSCLHTKKREVQFKHERELELLKDLLQTCHTGCESNAVRDKITKLISYRESRVIVLSPPELEQQRRKLKKILARFENRNTRFQCWLDSNRDYNNIKGSFLSKKWTLFHSKDQEIFDKGLLNSLVLFTMESMIARSVIVLLHSNSATLARFIGQSELTDIKVNRYPSQKSIQLINSLKRSLTEDISNANLQPKQTNAGISLLLRQLSKVERDLSPCSTESFSNKLHWHYCNISNMRLRRLIIREITLATQMHLVSKNTEKRRFNSEIIAKILTLLNPDWLISERNIVLIQAEYDINSERRSHNTGRTSNDLFSDFVRTKQTTKERSLRGTDSIEYPQFIQMREHFKCLSEVPLANLSEHLEAMLKKSEV